jgi:glycosyltransferase involved in cell wall biosynthesis
LIDPGDVEGLADAIAHLLSDDELRIRLRDLGLTRGRDFSYRNVAAGFTQILEEAVG